MQKKPELIFKRSFNINCTGDEPYPVPEFLILGNKAGLLWLSDQLRQQALSKKTSDQMEDDPDDHQHIDTMMPEVNRMLSDEVEIRLGLINSTNRNAVLSKYGITSDTKKSGSLVGQYENEIVTAKRETQKVAKILA